ncbi:hypothetical protein [Burkholderia cepacia]|uniref:hypothetical protein n=1 Tax=Burkholderia cepacia TaxID=292 RepID=UPI003EDEE730
MTNKNVDDTGATVEGKFGDVWEDTLIIAFRDLQWRRWLSDLDDARKKNNETKVAELEVLGPDDLHKLDGDAESLFGDVLTRHEGRYFVLEFKSTRAGHGAERDKTMFEKVADHLVTAHEKPRARFIELSTPCHFGVFGTRILKGESSRPTLESTVADPTAQAIPNSPRMGNLAIEAHTYLDWIHVYHRGLMDLTPEQMAQKTPEHQEYIHLLRAAANTSPSLIKAMNGITHRIESPHPRPLASLMWGQEHERAGADAAGYIEYLTVLTSVVGGDPKTPITLLAVVGATIYYWTTSVANLPHTIRYWRDLSERIALKAAVTNGGNQGATSAVDTSATGASKKVMKASGKG